MPIPLLTFLLQAATPMNPKGCECGSNGTWDGAPGREYLDKECQEGN